jgi:DNA-binding NarL/FixJ family response regulator
MKKVRILIADDHPIVREGYKKILMDMPDMVVSDEAANGQEVLNLVRKKDYDLILLDISMPGRNGLEILKDLKEEKPKLPVMILSIYPEEQYAVRAFRAGASGYLTKASAPTARQVHRTAPARNGIRNSMLSAMAPPRISASAVETAASTAEKSRGLEIQG